VKSPIQILLLSACLTFTAFGQTNTPTNTATPQTNASITVQTLICIRHGEKPTNGLGQLTPRGLNRGLALPDILIGRYGKPDYIFAPNPTQKVDDGRYYYVRPLATIEPTAIRCGLPVNTQYGYKEIKELEAEFEKPQYASSTIFMAWEHGKLHEFGKQMVQNHGGDLKQVPGWPGKDYDTIYVFKFIRGDGPEKFSFTVEHEGLNDKLTDIFPRPGSHE
jgi:hypothetical protein